MPFTDIFAKLRSISGGKLIDANLVEETADAKVMTAAERTLSIRCFAPYLGSNLATLADPIGTRKRADTYRAIRSLRLVGFEAAKPHRLVRLWNDYDNANGNHYFRMTLQSWDGAAWSDAFDTGAAVTMASLGFPNDRVVTYEVTVGTKYLRAEIDLSLITVNDRTEFNASTVVPPEMIVSKECFFDLRAVTGEIASVKVFVPYLGNKLAGLIGPIGNRTRGDVYKSLRSLRLVGFDATKPHKLHTLWNGNAGAYRLIIHALDAGAWGVVFDSGANVTMASLGFESDKIAVYEATIGTRSIRAEIDMSMVPAGDASLLNGSTVTPPEMIISRECFADMRTIVGEIASAKVFVPYLGNNLATLIASIGSKTRADVYRSIRSLKLIGFDRTKPHRLYAVWNNAAGANFRFMLSSYDAGTNAWTTVFDSGLNVTMASLGFSTDRVALYEATSASLSVRAEIDMALVPANDSSLFNGSTVTPPEMIISRECFADAELPTVDFSNYFPSAVWERYISDLGVLNAVSNGNRRKLKWQAFRNLKMIGFDKTKPHKLSFFIHRPQNQDPNTGIMYRLIFAAWDGAAWQEVYDCGFTAAQMTANGLIAGRVYHWDHLDQESRNTRVTAEIDFTNLLPDVNSGSAFTGSTPELVVASHCFEDAAGVSTADKVSLVNARPIRPTFRHRPTLAIIFDDRLPSDLDMMALFKSRGLRCGFACPISGITAGNIAPYQAAYADGFSILSHSDSGSAMSAAPADQAAIDVIDAKMKNSLAVLRSYGFDVTGFVTPSSVLHSAYKPSLQKYYEYAFTYFQDYSKFTAATAPLELSRPGIETLIQGSDGQGHSVASVLADFDDAIAKGECRVYYNHAVPSTSYTNPDGTPRVSMAEMTAIVDGLAARQLAGNVNIMAPDEAVATYYQTAARPNGAFA